MDENKTPTPVNDDETDNTVTDIETDEESEIADGNTAEAAKKPFDLASSLYEWLELFIVSFTAVMLIVLLIARHSPVVGSSMINTLHDGDLLIVSDLFYEPKRDDIIVFHSQNTGYDEPYVKRIIATEGQTVDIDFENWIVTVDGEVLDESYVYRPEGEAMRGSYMSFPVTVPEGHLFVMGDNRNGSSDSRSPHIGFVDERHVIGRVIFRLLPFDVIGTVD